MRPYSVRFCTITIPNVYATYTVPPGKRAVVRCVTCVNAGTSTGIAQAIAGGAIVAEARLQAATEKHYGELRIVLYAGDTVSLITTVAGIHASAHGYLFEDTGGLTDDNVEYRPRDHVELLPELAELENEAARSEAGGRRTA